MLIKKFTTAIAFTIATPIAAQDKAPLTGPDMSLEAISPTNEAVNVGLAGSDPSNIARYLMARGAGTASLSPDGKTVAFVFSATGKRQLWSIPAQGGQPRQLTYGNGVPFFRWSPDNTSLIYGADNDGDEQEAYYKIAADGSSEDLLFPAVKGGFRRFGAYSADGSTITYASTERNGLDFDIYTADLKSGETNRLYEGRFGFFSRSIFLS